MRPFTDDRRELLRARVRTFAEGLPRRGAEPEPREVVRLLAEAGLFRLGIPAAFGGDAATVEPLSLAVAREELAYASGLADALFAVQALGAYPLVVAGTGEERARWLPRLARGEAVAAFAVTEPEAGSDLGAVTTAAQRDGDGYRLDGQKVFISNAGIADMYIVLAQAEGGPTAFVVPAAGLETTSIAMLASHPVGTVRLRGVKVPAIARLGREGEGLALCLGTLELFRATVGASACGLARRALDEALRRVQARKQFGRPLAEQQALRFALADAATELDAARLLVYRAAWLKEASPEARNDRESAMAKLKATETAQSVVDLAVQLHGAAGLVRGSTVEALYREVRALRIYEGTSEIQKVVISRTILTV